MVYPDQARYARLAAEKLGLEFVDLDDGDGYVFAIQSGARRILSGAGWICTWKGALRLWPELPRFSNQMLRYVRRPEGLVHELGLPAHRAQPDAYVTAHHLRDMLNETSVDRLLRWSQEPGLLPRVPTGSNRGKAFGEISDAALRTFAEDRDIDLRFSAETELRRRTEGSPPVPSPLRQQRLL